MQSIFAHHFLWKRRNGRRYASTVAKRRGGLVISTDRQTRREIIAWVGKHVVPNEAVLRTRLHKLGVSDAEVEDVVQDAYLALVQLKSTGHIRNPRAYFFTAARNAYRQRRRREKIVGMDSLTSAQIESIASDVPDAERQVGAKFELERMAKIIEALPDRCREIFLLRRVKGASQRDIAARLGVSEEVVEAQAIRGLKLIIKAIEAEETLTGRGRFWDVQGND